MRIEPRTFGLKVRFPGFPGCSHHGTSPNDEIVKIFHIHSQQTFSNWQHTNIKYAVRRYMLNAVQCVHTIEKHYMLLVLQE